MNGPFHPGELQAQARVGVTAGSAGIRDYMPDQHRSFFPLLPYLLMATRDPDGAPRARMLTGPAGFVDSPTPTMLRIAAATELSAGSVVGLLGLDFSTRRRNRANGTVSANDGRVLEVAVRQSFGNCPQYISLRSVRAVAPEQHAALSFDGLHPDAAALVRAADTFFIASTGGEHGLDHGLDVSHRGGPPGFVTIDGDTLVVPDYLGNRFFNTLGNLLLDARAALLFVGFDSGDVLELRGRAEVEWDTRASVAGEDGGGRRWRFQVERGSLRRAALPLRWQPIA
jgi:hypothetical protein